MRVEPILTKQITKLFRSKALERQAPQSGVTYSAEFIETPTEMMVSTGTWMIGMPQHAKGLLVYYGSQQLIEANARFHNYDLGPYRDRCGVSAMSPTDLGKVIWLRVGDQPWYGPCLTIDVAAQVDFWRIVYKTQEIAEVSTYLRDLFQFKYGSSGWGEAWLGLCPPRELGEPQFYRPRPAEHDWAGPNPRHSSPPQQYPVDCSEHEAKGR